MNHSKCPVGFPNVLEGRKVLHRCQNREDRYREWKSVSLSKYIDPKNIPAYLKGGERVNDSDGDETLMDGFHRSQRTEEFEENSRLN